MYYFYLFPRLQFYHHFTPELTEVSISTGERAKHLFLISELTLLCEGNFSEHVQQLMISKSDGNKIPHFKRRWVHNDPGLKATHASTDRFRA